MDDPSFVFLRTQDIQPALQVGGRLLVVIVDDMCFHPEKCSAHLGDEFLLGIDLPSEAVMLDEAFAIQPLWVTAGVNQLVEEYLIQQKKKHSSNLKKGKR